MGRMNLPVHPLVDPGRHRGPACRVAGVVLALCTLLLWQALPTHAAPAPWYYWRSKVDGHRICAQTSPGPGWTQDSGPYAGANCLLRRVLAQPAK